MGGIPVKSLKAGSPFQCLLGGFSCSNANDQNNYMKRTFLPLRASTKDKRSCNSRMMKMSFLYKQN